MSTATLVSSPSFIAALHRALAAYAPSQLSYTASVSYTSTGPCVTLCNVLGHPNLYPSVRSAVRAAKRHLRITGHSEAECSIDIRRV